MDWLLITVSTVYLGVNITYTPMAGDVACARAAIAAQQAAAEVRDNKSRWVATRCVDLRTKKEMP